MSKQLNDEAVVQRSRFSMKWIGLTGGIASGKSTVSRILQNSGYPVIDADQVAKSIVEPGTAGLRQVVLHFGPEVLKLDGSLDRQKIGSLVFKNSSELRKLESILHPLIQKETARRKGELEARGERIAFYDVPLLFEKNLESQFDAIVLVSTSLELQKRRMKERDQLSDEEISHRLGAQIPLAEKIGKATWVLHNQGTLHELETATLKLLDEIQAGKSDQSGKE